jgi:hypothetical protein
VKIRARSVRMDIAASPQGPVWRDFSNRTRRVSGGFHVSAKGLPAASRNVQSVAATPIEPSIRVNERAPKVTSSRLRQRARARGKGRNHRRLGSFGGFSLPNVCRIRPAN